MENYYIIRSSCFINYVGLCFEKIEEDKGECIIMEVDRKRGHFGIGKCRPSKICDLLYNSEGFSLFSFYISVGFYHRTLYKMKFINVTAGYLCDEPDVSSNASTQFSGRLKDGVDCSVKDASQGFAH